MPLVVTPSKNTNKTVESEKSKHSSVSQAGNAGPSTRKRPRASSLSDVSGDEDGKEMAFENVEDEEVSAPSGEDLDIAQAMAGVLSKCNPFPALFVCAFHSAPLPLSQKWPGLSDTFSLSDLVKSACNQANLHQKVADRDASLANSAQELGNLARENVSLKTGLSNFETSVVNLQKQLQDKDIILKRIDLALKGSEDELAQERQKVQTLAKEKEDMNTYTSQCKESVLKAQQFFIGQRSIISAMTKDREADRKQIADLLAELALLKSSDAPGTAPSASQELPDFFNILLKDPREGDPSMPSGASNAQM